MKKKLVCVHGYYLDLFQISPILKHSFIRVCSHTENESPVKICTALLRFYFIFDIDGSYATKKTFISFIKKWTEKSRFFCLFNAITMIFQCWYLLYLISKLQKYNRSLNNMLWIFICTHVAFGALPFPEIGRLFWIVNSKIFRFSSHFNLYLAWEMWSNYLIKIFDTINGLFKNKDNIKMKPVN